MDERGFQLGRHGASPEGPVNKFMGGKGEDKDNLGPGDLKVPVTRLGGAQERGLHWECGEGVTHVPECMPCPGA